MSTHVAEYDCLFKDYLEVRSNEAFGRGVYSKKVIVQGVEIIRSDPVAHVVEKRERKKRCDWCTTRREDLKKCSLCKYVWYCGSVCQKADWLYHKVECKGISKISPNVPTDTVRLLVRLLSKGWGNISAPPPPQLQLSTSCGADWETSILTSHAPRYSEELKEAIATQVMGVKLMLGTEQGFNGEQVFSLACKVTCNTFHILDDEMMTIGMGVYLPPTFINHSCHPNCITVFDGRTVKIRTVRNIKQGEQLFISYCEELDTGERRRKCLQKYHLFQCTCERCHGDKEEGSLNRLMTSTAGLSAPQSKDLLTKGFEVLDKCDELKKSFNWEELRNVSSGFVEAHGEMLGDRNIVLIKMREHLMDACIELGLWKEGYDVSLLLKEAYELYYPQINPFVGLHYFKMAKLLNQTKADAPSLRDSIALLNKSVGVLSVTHGSDHPLVVEGTMLMRDLSAEMEMQSDKR